MTTYSIDNLPTLTTKAPATNERWNGFYVPVATYAELLAYCDAVVTHESTESALWGREPSRELPYVALDIAGRPVLYWGCEDSDACEDSPDVVYVGNGFGEGWHVHSRDAWVGDEDGTLRLNGMTWDTCNGFALYEDPTQ